MKERKRLMSPHFVAKYQHFLKPDGIMYLKTDSRLLYDYIRELIPLQQWRLLEDIEDVYSGGAPSILTEIQTFYEKHWLEGGSTISYVSWKLD